MSDAYKEVRVGTYSAEAAALRQGGVALRSIAHAWYGPLWVNELIHATSWSHPELTAIAAAITRGLDPDAVLAAMRLGGRCAVLDIIKAS